MMKRILTVIAIIMMCAVLSGTALADYGYTSVSQIPMAYPFTVEVEFDENGHPQIITDYPFEDAGADEMNLVYNDSTGGQAFTLNYNSSTKKTKLGTHDRGETEETAYRKIRSGEVTRGDEITINTAHFKKGTNWFLVYSSRENNYIRYSEAIHAQHFDGLGEGGVRITNAYRDGELDSVSMLKRARGRDADLVVEYNKHGGIEFASIQLFENGESFNYDYDPHTGLFGGHPITELGFIEGDLEIEALAAEDTQAETEAEEYETRIETQIVSDAQQMAKSTIRVSGGLVTGVMMGIVLYYMIRRRMQNAKEKAARKKENAEKAAGQAEETPETVEPPQTMYSSSR